MYIVEDELYPFYQVSGDDHYRVHNPCSLTYEQWVDSMIIENLFEAHQQLLESVYMTDQKAYRDTLGYV
jgi:hypothetical protein